MTLTSTGNEVKGILTIKVKGQDLGNYPAKLLKVSHSHKMFSLSCWLISCKSIFWYDSNYTL